MSYTPLLSNIEHQDVFDRICNHLQRPWKVHSVHEVTEQASLCRAVMKDNMIYELKDIYSERKEFNKCEVGTPQLYYYISCQCNEFCNVKLKVIHHHQARCDIHQNEALHPSSSKPDPTNNNLLPKVISFIKKSAPTLKRTQIKEQIRIWVQIASSLVVLLLLVSGAKISARLTTYDDNSLKGELSFSSLNESQVSAVQDSICCSVTGSTNYVYCLSGQTCCRKSGYSTCIASSYACCSSSQTCSSNVCVSNSYGDYDALGYGLGFGIPGFIIFIAIIIIVSAASRKRRLMMMRRAQEQQAAAAVGVATMPSTLVTAQPTMPPVSGGTTVVIQNPGPGVYYPPQQQPYGQQYPPQQPYGQPMMTQQPYQPQYGQPMMANQPPPTYVTPQPSYYTPPTNGNGQQTYV